MAPLRPVSLAALTSLLIALCTWASPAVAVGARLHHKRQVRCTRFRRIHGRVGSFHAGHTPTRSHRHHAACRGHHNRHTAAGQGRGVGQGGGGTHGKPTRGQRGHSHSHSRSNLADTGTCTGTELRPTPQNTEAIRAATICLVNRERASHGEGPLQDNAKLQGAAQDHTESMAWEDYFEHLGPGGQTPLDRMRIAGYIYSSNIGFEVGENIAWGTGALGTPRAIVAAWMASPDHRANILDPHFRDTAIGVSPHPPSSLAHGQLGGIYTQDFGVITR